MREHRPVAQLERRQLRRSGRSAQFVTRALAQEGDRVAVSGDDLLVLEPFGAERLLHTAARVDPRAAAVAVADCTGRPDSQGQRSLSDVAGSA